MFTDDYAAIVSTLNRYATACDTRDWALFDEVFTADAGGDYGPGFVHTGRTALVAGIRSMLGGCGPTQHLLGNYDIAVDGDTATAACKVRAYHVGLGDKAHLSYECFGSYHDRLVRTGDGWRIAHRAMRVTINLGTFEVLGPG